jgi:hypothetical protein
MSDEAVGRIAQFFETLSPAAVQQLGSIYTPDAYFKDPFNEVRGEPAIAAIFRHMYVALDAPRFVVTGQVVQGGACFLVWDFKFFFKGQQAKGGKEQTVRGTSHLKLAGDGRICYHRDYWDAAEELYEKLPVLGSFMRWLKRRAGGA